MNEQDEKIRELERRISVLEKGPPGNSGGVIKMFVFGALAVILGITLILMLIGVIQFVSAG